MAERSPSECRGDQEQSTAHDTGNVVAPADSAADPVSEIELQYGTKKKVYTKILNVPRNYGLNEPANRRQEWYRVEICSGFAKRVANGA
jgi:hypothetical protein